MSAKVNLIAAILEAWVKATPEGRQEALAYLRVKTDEKAARS